MAGLDSRTDVRIAFVAAVIVCAAGPGMAQQPMVKAASPAAAPAPIEAPKPQAPAAKQWPKLVPGTEAPAQAPRAWSEAEIKIAQARCIEVLKGLDVAAIGATPFRENNECGSAAPIELISVGKSPQVAFSPTVTVTCDMAAALHKWVVGDLQPLAKKHLGAPLVRIDTMSSYSCRNAYGRTKSRLSEHGRANAIDIRGFTTAKGDTADVLADWGLTAREIQAQVAAAKAAAAAKALAATKAPEPTATPGKGDAANGGREVATGTLRPALDGQTPPAAALAPSQAPGATIPVPGVTLRLPGLSRETVNPFAPPSQLGGPKASQQQPAAAAKPGPAQAALPPPVAAASSARTLFLRAAHQAACRLFGTTLGPEANNAHKNHFHVDMAERSSSNFCE